MNTIKVKKPSSNPDQARRFVEPNLGPDCLQRLSADGTIVGKELMRSKNPAILKRAYISRHGRNSKSNFQAQS